MSLLTRINVYIFERQRKFFQELKEKEGISFAEALRRAIDDFIIKWKKND